MQDKVAHAPQVLTDAFVDLYPNEVAYLLETVPTEDIVAFLEEQSARRACMVLEKLSPPIAAQCLLQLKDEHAQRVLSGLDHGRAAVLLSHLDELARENRLSLVDARLATELKELLSYPEDTAGHLMDTQVMAFGENLNIGEALARLRAFRRIRTQHIVVLGDDNKLTGMIPLAEAVLSEPSETLGSLIKTAPPQVQAMAPRDEVVDVLARAKVSTLPVVDLDGRLLGVIRHEALVQAVQEEATADLQTMVGVSKDERALSTPFFAVRKRLPWLNINLLTAFLAAAVVGIFEGTIAQFTALAVLLPVVAGQSGNTGAQALAVTMRGLALREIRLRHGRQVLIKEGLVGALNGVVIAVVTAVGVYVWSRSLGLSFVIFLAMIISMVLAGLAGAAIPLVLAALRQDPAQSGSIILTTVTDVAGFFSFLGLATVFASLL